jgi:PAT family beta-lactamase induction signal transducer AmpG
VWAPVVDRVPLPVLNRLLGRRRSWMLVAQIGIASALLGLAALHPPQSGMAPFVLFAMLLAFSAATQDIALDAWRIEIAPPELQGALVGTYSVGYRLAVLSSSAGALYIADHSSWNASYLTMAALVAVGVITTLTVREPVVTLSRAEAQREERVVEWLERNAHLPNFMRKVGEWFFAAVICPLVDFFARYGAVSVLILAFIVVYRLTDFTMGSMTGIFYRDHGYSKTEIALVVKTYGFSAAILGAIFAGPLIARLGLLRSLALGTAMELISSLNFAALASTHTPDLLWLGLVNVFDNLALAVHGIALIAFLSSLTARRYTATQYALFSSLYSVAGKALEGTSGYVIDHIGRNYSIFFTYTAALSLPGLILLYFLARRQRHAPATALEEGAG